VHIAVDALGHLLAVHVMPADERGRAHMYKLREDGSLQMLQ